MQSVIVIRTDAFSMCLQSKYSKSPARIFYNHNYYTESLYVFTFVFSNVKYLTFVYYEHSRLNNGYTIKEIIIG
jgi:hypothetical protein